MHVHSHDYHDIRQTLNSTSGPSMWCYIPRIWVRRTRTSRGCGQILEKPVLGDPGAVSRSGEKAGRKFSLQAKGPRVPTLTKPFPKIQADAGSRLGTKNALYYFAQSANTSQMSSFRVFIHDGYCFDHGLSSLCTKEMHAVRKLSVWYKIPIWSNSLTLSNASELFWSWISKFMKRMNFVIACLRPSQNVKLGIFTGSRAVDGKEMYKKAWCTCKVVVLPCQAVSYLTFSSLPNLNCDPLKTEYSRGKFNIIALADSNPNVFSTHR